MPSLIGLIGCHSAFDLVSRESLWQVLERRRMLGRVLSSLQSINKQDKACVLTHEISISATKAILSGSQNPMIRQMSTLWATWTSRFRGPHCGQEVLGGCKVPAFKAMYIARHDQALRLILKSIAKGDHGGYYKIADIGRAEVIEDMGVSAKTILPWLLPDSCLERADIDPADRNRLRPDIMLVNMSQSECMSYERHSRRQLEFSTTTNSQSRANGSSGPQRRRVWLIEGGYTSDTRHLAKLAEKETQHRKLVGALELRGFDVKPMICFWGWRHDLQIVPGGHAPARSQHYGNHKNFEGSSFAFCHMCNKHHHPMQNLGQARQAEASTDTETAALDHHPHNNPVFSQGLAGSRSVSLLTDSVTNA